MLQYTTALGKQTAYRKSGQGAALVLLHGFCEDSTMWSYFVTQLQEKYTILSIDLSGFGHSELLADHSIEAMAEQVQAVLAVEQISKAVIIGHSMGAYVGLAFAEKYPEKLSGLGFFHSHPFADSESKKQNRKKAIAFIQKHGVSPFVGHLFPSLFSEAFVKAQPEVVHNFVDQCSTHHSDAIIAASKAMLQRKDRSDILAALSCPILHIIGGKDSIVPIQTSLKQSTLAAQSSIHILREVGHMGMFEAPDKTLKIVDGFMEFCVV
ncbi:MAG: alpha/beta hydrolase [Saprospiraceae bacterium]|nr:alpha/beta hydrolase [Saprospiraceae bacterium]